MERWLVLIVLTVLITGGITAGVWGSIILSRLFKRRSLGNSVDDPRFERLAEESQQLEGRLERLEEEIQFLRELRKPEVPPQLPGSNQE